MGTALDASGGGGELHERVFTALQRQIADGRFADAGRLPSERLLREAFGVSRLTIRRALGRLADEHQVVAVQGKGWFVSSAAPVNGSSGGLQSMGAAARARGFTVSAEVLDQRVRPASLEEAESLGIVAGSDVFDLRRLRLLEGVRIAVDRVRLPLAAAPWLTSVDFRIASLHASMEEHGLAAGRADEQIGVLDADDELASLLDVAPGRGLLHSTGITLDQFGRPVCLTWVVFRADRYRISITATRSSRYLASPIIRFGGRSWPPVARPPAPPIRDPGET